MIQFGFLSKFLLWCWHTCTVLSLFCCRSRSWLWPSSLVSGRDKWKSGFRTEGQGEQFFLVWWGIWGKKEQWILVIYGVCVLQDQVEANGGWLWVPEEVLRESDGGEQAVAKGGSGAESTETFPTVLHANDPTHHPHHVPLVWACRGPTQLHVIICHCRSPGPSPPDGSDPPSPGHPHRGPVAHRLSHPATATTTTALRRLPRRPVVITSPPVEGILVILRKKKERRKTLYLERKSRSGSWSVMLLF